MDFNKCSRCGNFFLSNDDVCPKCKTKDTLEFTTFKNYISENGIDCNMNVLSTETGITSKNINRYLTYSNLSQNNEINNIKL